GAGDFEGRALGDVWHLPDCLHVRDAAGHRGIAVAGLDSAGPRGPNGPGGLTVLPDGVQSTHSQEGTMKRTRLVALALVGVLGPERSEEHTSELQSRFDIVCRLLLEKKKKYYSLLLILRH